MDISDLFITFFILCLLVYFLPTIIALICGSNRKGAVFAMNLFLGWTFIGWIWALVWAVSSKRQQQNVIINNHISTDRIINPIITQPLQENFQSIANKQLDKIETTNIKSHLDKINQLQKIKELLDNSIITQEEFNEQKSKILAS